MPNIERTSQAETDLIEIADFIARDNPVAAFQLLDRFDEKFAMLSRQPLIGEPRDDLAEGLRQFTLGDYAIYYVPVENGVRVFACFTGPAMWRPSFQIGGKCRRDHAESSTPLAS